MTDAISAAIKFHDLSVVVPAYNENAGIKVSLDGLIEKFPEAEIIVVDDGSCDGTFKTIMGRAGVVAVQHAYNRGQGAALKTGMRLATRKYVAWFDADNEHRTEDLAKCYSCILRENLVAVIGQRTNRSASWLRGAGKWLIRLVGRGLNINAGNDLNCGLRVFRRDAILNYIPLIPDRFSASLVTTLVLLERGYPVAFEPVKTAPRVGQSTVRLKDGFDAILALVRAVLLFAPMRFFMPLGLGLIGIGGIYSLATAFIRGEGLPLAGGLIVGTGVVFIVVGLVTDQISQLRLSLLPNETPLSKTEQTGKAKQ